MGDAARLGFNLLEESGLSRFAYFDLAPTVEKTSPKSA